MALKKTMYKGVANSPETTITNNINETDTLIYVLDETRIPAELPNLMVLGTGTGAETIKVLSIEGNAITVERGFQGVAKAWNAGTVIARNFTEYDYNALKENIEGLDENIGDLDELDTTEKDNIVGAINEVVDDLDSHLAENASLSKRGHIKHGIIETTLNTTWTGTSAPFSKAQAVTGILSTDTPIIDVVMSGTLATDEARLEAWGHIYRAVTSANTITFYAMEKPTVALPLQIKVVR